MTKIVVTPFQPQDAFDIELQNMQQGCITMTQETADALKEIGPAFTGRDADSGDIVGCSGLWMRHQGVSDSWGLLSRRATGSTLLAITRVVRLFLDGRSEHRISGTALTGWEAGRRWLILLGFTYEGTMRAYTEDQRDVDLYARAGGKASCSSQVLR